jgi:hypothetical protein
MTDAKTIFLSDHQATVRRLPADLVGVTAIAAYSSIHTARYYQRWAISSSIRPCLPDVRLKTNAGFTLTVDYGADGVNS